MLSNKRELDTIVLIDDDEHLYHYLKDLSLPVVLVKTDTGFEKIAPDRFNVALNSEANLQLLWQELKRGNQQAQKVIYLVHNPEGLPSTIKTLLMQGAPVSFARVLRHTNDEVMPEQDCLAALLRTVCAEHSEARCVLLELDTSAAQPANLHRILTEELQGQGAAHLRFRHGQRFVRRFERLPSLKHYPNPIREGGTYLITGGSGELGLIVAEYLTGRSQVNLILTGRSQPSKKVVAALKSFEQSGSHALYLQADVTNEASMQTVLVETKKQFRELNGVFHCAGVLKDGLLLDKDLNDYRAVLAPKVQGAKILDNMTCAEPLDIFVLFSSLVSVLGNPGQSDYATANAFLDSFADRRETLRTQGQRQGRTVSVNWPLWRDGGMQLEAKRIERFSAQTGIQPLTTEAGLQALESALCSDATQLIPLVGDLASIERTMESLGSQQKSATSTVSSNAEIQSRGEVLKDLTALLANELGCPSDVLDIHQPLADLGVDSFLTLRVLKRLQKHYGAMPKDLLVQYPTITTLAEYLSSLNTGMGTDDQTEVITPTNKKPAESSQEWNAGVMNDLIIMLADELGCKASTLNPDTGLADMGVDSFLTLRILKRLEKQYGHMPKDLLLHYPSVTKLAEYLHSLNTTTLTSSAINRTKDTDNIDKILEKSIASWLVPIFTSELQIPEDNFAYDTSLADYGLDSFLTLRVLKKLEKDLGKLPKSLFMEHNTIDQLIEFMSHHYRDALMNKFAMGLTVNTDTELTADVKKVSNTFNDNQPIILKADALSEYPDLRDKVEHLMRKYGGLIYAQSRREIAPYIFIGAQHEGVFYFHRDEERLFSPIHVCSEEELPGLTSELVNFAFEQGLRPNILSEVPLTHAGTTALSATPFAVMQRITDIADFSLQGAKMRRLRYLVSKFEKQGQPRTEEYQIGSEKETDQMIIQVIDRWCELKSMINPYIERVKQEISTGNLPGPYRTFLTWQNDVLQNVIIITDVPSENGYFMDLEFYSEAMSLGGLEYAATKIIAILKEEEKTTFSLGLTFGAWLSHSENADPNVVEMLVELQKQGINDGTGNFQFKNKFRTENSNLYLCRAKNDQTNDIADIMMMIANPEPLLADTITISGSVAQQSKIEKKNDEETTNCSKDILERQQILANYGYNAMNIPSDKVEFDLMTDSWAQLEISVVQQYMEALHKKIVNIHCDIDAVLRLIFPFKYLIPVASGRMAESYLAPRLSGNKSIVVQNILFPTWILHQINQGLKPIELPLTTAFDIQIDKPFKADLDCEALRKLLLDQADQVAFVCMELACNALGGQAVSLANLQQVRSLLEAYRIPLVLDATRILENACYIEAFEAGHKGRDIWDIVQEICCCGDVLTASLGKDFSIDIGGIIAVNDRDIYIDLKDAVVGGGSGLNKTSQKLIAAALANREEHLVRVRNRMRHVQQLADAFIHADLPLVRPIGGHCILIDVNQLPAFALLDYALPTFLAYLYEQTGIRAGLHTVGMQQGTPLNHAVRLAVPVGLRDEDVEAISYRLVAAFQNQRDVFALELVAKESGLMGDAHATYRLKSTPQPTRMNSTTNMLTVNLYDERAIRCIKPGKNSLTRLLAFHPFGCGIQSLSWMNKLPEEIEIWSVGAEHLSRWENLIPYLAESIRDFLDKPIVIWGHSMGGIVAFEVINYLEKNYGADIKQLIISSAPTPMIFESVKHTAPFSGLNNSLSEVEVKKLLAEHHVLLPKESGIPTISSTGLRNDILLCQTYRHEVMRKLNVPLCTVQASNDIFFLNNDSIIKQWQGMTCGLSQHYEIEGDHAFFINPPKKFSDILIQYCRQNYHTEVKIGDVSKLKSQTLHYSH